MRWSEIDFHPSSRTMHQFAAMWLTFFGGLSIWAASKQMTWATCGLGGVALVGGVGGWLKPAMLRPIYSGWMVAAFPLGWLVSHVLLALLYFGLFTPLALAFKLLGRDALRRRREPDLVTYWAPKAAVSDVRSYFSPF
jgi:Saxitoxin biosynthesis operon protein SxtJ